MKSSSLVTLALPAILSLLGCGRDATVPERHLEAGEGFVDVEGGKVWYEIVGSGSATPLLVLHGGPGAPSDYLRPLARLADERPVVFYDQLGCGRSDRPEDPALWTVDRFVAELAEVRRALGLDEIHILGHSWGTMLAVDYMLTRPEGVKSLVLASPALSIPKWLDDANRLKEELPETTRGILERHEAAGTTDSEEYGQATMEYYQRYLCRLDPWPPELEAALGSFGWDVYHTMWGPSEFHATGSLADYDATPRLGELDLPVLFTAGRHDEATPETVEGYRDLVPGARLEIFEDASHMTMLEKPEAYAEAVRSFLRDVEGS